jgi:hypothetical protein
MWSHVTCDHRHGVITHGVITDKAGGAAQNVVCRPQIQKPVFKGMTPVEVSASTAPARDPFQPRAHGLGLPPRPATTTGPTARRQQLVSKIEAMVGKTLPLIVTGSIEWPALGCGRPVGCGLGDVACQQHASGLPLPPPQLRLAAIHAQSGKPLPPAARDPDASRRRASVVTEDGKIVTGMLAAGPDDTGAGLPVKGGTKTQSLRTAPAVPSPPLPDIRSRLEVLARCVHQAGGPWAMGVQLRAAGTYKYCRAEGLH